MKARKFSGGEVLGEGAHGKAINAGCGPTGESFCKLIHKKIIKEVVLYTDRGEIVLYSDDIPEFLEFVNSIKNSIAKVFKPTGKPAVLQAKLDEEIAINRTISSLYGPFAETFTTIAPIAGFRDHKIYGVRVQLKGETLYAIFGSKCKSKYRLEMQECIVNILLSLSLLNEKGYYHNDIKFDNIVKCDGIYKLIDWGAAIPIDFKIQKHGTLLGTSPIRWFLMGFNQTLSSIIISNKTYFGKYHVYKSPYFKTTNKRIQEEFFEIMAENLSPVMLFERFKHSFDVFMLGIMILHGVIEHDLDWTTYKPFVDAFTSLKKPIGARAALDVIASKI